MRFIRLSVHKLLDCKSHVNHKLGFVPHANTVTIHMPLPIGDNTVPWDTRDKVLRQPILKQKVFLAQRVIHLLYEDVVHKQSDELVQTHLTNRRPLGNLDQNLILRLVGTNKTNIGRVRKDTLE